MTITNIYANLTWASTNLTGDTNAHGDSLETWTTNTGNVSWEARFGMDNLPAGDKMFGMQYLNVMARKESGKTGTPTLTVQLYEDGNFISTLVTNQAITSSTGVIISAEFDGELITNPNNLEFYLIATAAGGSPGARTSVQIDWINVEANHGWVPGAVTDLTATAGAILSQYYQEIELNWSAPTTPEGETILDYQIRTSTNGGSTWDTWITNGGAATFRNWSELRGSTYHFQVRGVTNFGYAPPSNTAFVELPADSSGGIKGSDGTARPLRIFPGGTEATAKVLTGSGWITLGS